MLKKLFSSLPVFLFAALFMISCSKSEPIVEISSVSIKNPPSTLMIGETHILSVETTPLNITEPYTLSYSSSSPSVAEVNGSGRITAVSAGTAVISVSVTGNPQIKDEFTLAVAPQYLAPQNTKFQKVAYFPSYRDLAAIPDSKLQMIDVACFAFAAINSDYTLTLEEPTKLSALVTRCHNLGVKVLISLNGSHSLYATMTSSAENRAKFIQSLKKIVNDYQLDGVDNDWEYPKTSDNSHKGNTALMKELSQWLHNPSVNKLLTMAITPGKYVGAVSNGIENDCFQYVDWFNIMVYDDYSETVAGINHSTFALMETAYNYWVGARSMPKYKFVGGMPVYGRASGITQSGTAMGYVTILSKGGDPDANQAEVTISTWGGGTTPYTIYYNGRPLIRQKTRYCIDQKLGGIMFWEAGQDSENEFSLIRAAHEEVGSYRIIE